MIAGLEIILLTLDLDMNWECNKLQQCILSIFPEYCELESGASLSPRVKLGIRYH